MYVVNKMNLFEAPRGVGFTGVLLKDGEKIADISNPGDGSCDDIRFVRLGLAEDFYKYEKEWAKERQCTAPEPLGFLIQELIIIDEVCQIMSEKIANSDIVYSHMIMEMVNRPIIGWNLTGASSLVPRNVDLKKFTASKNWDKVLTLELED